MQTSWLPKQAELVLNKHSAKPTICLLFDPTKTPISLKSFSCARPVKLFIHARRMHECFIVTTKRLKKFKRKRVARKYLHRRSSLFAQSNYCLKRGWLILAVNSLHRIHKLRLWGELLPNNNEIKWFSIIRVCVLMCGLDGFLRCLFVRAFRWWWWVRRTNTSSIGSGRWECNEAEKTAKRRG